MKHSSPAKQIYMNRTGVSIGPIWHKHNFIRVCSQTQCLPTQTTQSDTKTESDTQLQLYVNNGTEATNYHLTRAVSELETEDQMINAELNAILPYLNFLVRMVDIALGQDEETFEGTSNSIE